MSEPQDASMRRPVYHLDARLVELTMLTQGEETFTVRLDFDFARQLAADLLITLNRIEDEVSGDPLHRFCPN